MTVAIWASIGGWVLTIILHLQGIRRAEASRMRDRLIDRLEHNADWLVNQIEIQTFQATDIEEVWSGKVSLVETYLASLNAYTGCEILDGKQLVGLRNINLELVSSETAIEAIKVTQDISIEIHTNYLKNYFLASKTFLWLRKVHAELVGAILCLVVLLLFFSIMVVLS